MLFVHHRTSLDFYFALIRTTAAKAGLGLPAKIAIGTVTGLVVLGAVLGPSLYFGLAGKKCVVLRYTLATMQQWYRAKHI